MTNGKIKIVRGESFITLEDTKHLAEGELTDLITYLSKQPFTKDTFHLNILVHSKFSKEIGWLLKKHGFIKYDEIIIVLKHLKDAYVEKPYTFIDLHTINEKEFLATWERVMTGSLNSTSINVEKQMDSLKIELGSRYRDSCILAFEGEKPIGVTIPHIEAGTIEEGRLFYFGLIPEERGKGKSTILHRQTLSLLKSKFKATTYIGNTSEKNIPMLQVFRNNKCKVLEKNKVYKRIIHNND